MLLCALFAPAERREGCSPGMPTTRTRLLPDKVSEPLLGHKRFSGGAKRWTALER
jgi:hypothetical protein